MPKPVSKKQAMRTEATRAKLVRAAYGVFIKDGFAGASIDDVAEKAGYSRGAFYANFEDKERSLKESRRFATIMSSSSKTEIGCYSFWNSGCM
jgi:AcrR family transcriptional regulator